MLDIAICNNDVRLLDQIENKIVKTLFDENELNIDLYDSDDEFCDVFTQSVRDYDIVFVNVDLESHDGFEVADLIRKNDTKCEIVFTCKTLKKPLQAFKYNAFDYLLIPVEEDELSALFERYSFYHYSNKEEFFSFKSRMNQDRIKIRSILYFASSGRKISIVTANREVEFYSKLDDVEILLENNGFIRIHQSYLINPAYIKSIVNGDVIMENDDYLPISRNRIKEVKNSYMEYMR